MGYPKDYKYTREHEWIQVNGSTGTVGITDHAQDSLGDIVFVELPKVGTQLQAGKSFGTVESVKAVSELYAPASGTVTAVNDALKPITGERQQRCALRLDGQDRAYEPQRGERPTLGGRLREVHS